jgi:hypothetical protein
MGERMYVNAGYVHRAAVRWREREREREKFIDDQIDD